ncbi:Nop52-domain-containing protein [Neolentinus lepideus HHB14362 ss-1]|uniref:Nop52-domain-containing protein n=1 Tax=Neolentinus lepideus HHB14362 ss-1 TaxID=1314782 RepID=A0A165WA27_9AGAM|nr:Nop52-domain-containing protein [Neolentinus lepideus HHB14362 ss-1]
MASDPAPPLAKLLASTDKKTRDKATKQLASFLSNSSLDALSKSELAKLWKGIFYCFWMSDKPLIQQALANELADLLLTSTSKEASLAFLSGFWEATVREWSGIDRLRMDKYYMLVRRFTNASFRLLIREKWDSTSVSEYNHILTRKGGPMCTDDQRVPASLSYHLADIYLEELDKAMTNAPVSEPLPAPLSTLLSPFFILAARTPSNVTYQRIQSALIEPLFSSLKSSSPESEAEEASRRKRPRLEMPGYKNLISNACSIDPEEEKALPEPQLRAALLRKMFDVASHEDSRDSNRRKMYTVWKVYKEDEDVDRPLDAS